MTKNFRSVEFGVQYYTVLRGIYKPLIGSVSINHPLFKGRYLAPMRSNPSGMSHISYGMLVDILLGVLCPHCPYIRRLYSPAHKTRGGRYIGMGRGTIGINLVGTSGMGGSWYWGVGVYSLPLPPTVYVP